jgi:hypothetical protein
MPSRAGIMMLRTVAPDLAPGFFAENQVQIERSEQPDTAASIASALHVGKVLRVAANPLMSPV